MKTFRGRDPKIVEILNNLCDMIDKYDEMDKDLEGVLYLGREEMHALKTVSPQDISIDVNYETGDIKLWNFPIVPVAKHSYAALAPSKVWRR